MINNEFHLLEPWNEKKNVKKIIAVKDATFAVAKRKPEKNSGFAVILFTFLLTSTKISVL